MATGYFTVLGQCVVGALIVSGIGWLPPKMTQTVSVLSVACFSSGFDGHRVYCLCHAPGIATAGVNSLNRIGASGLSNEIAAGSIFLPLADYGGWWRSSVKCRKLGETLVTCQHGARRHFRLDDTCVYQIDTVPTWHNGYTTLASS